MGTFACMADEKVSVEVAGRRLTLSNLSKILYPPTDGSHGFTKAEVVDYYTRVSPVLLPHLAGRPATFIRFPDGVAGKSFFEKNAPSHTPEWVRTVTLPSPGSGMRRDTIDYVVVEDLPTLVWAANLASLELHVPQWTVGPLGIDDDPRDPDLLVLDLDPGPPATVVECSRVAVLLRERLAADGLDAFPKTSGSKGMQLYVPLEPTSAELTSRYAKTLAEDLERADPGLVVSRMAKELRTRQGVRRLVAEQRGQDHGGAVLAAGPPAADRVHPADLGRGARRAATPRTWCSPHRTSWTASSASATCWNPC